MNAQSSSCQTKATRDGCTSAGPSEFRGQLSLHLFCSPGSRRQGIDFQWPAQQAPPQGGRPFLPRLPPSSPDPRSTSCPPTSCSPAFCPGRDGAEMLGDPAVTGHSQGLPGPSPRGHARRARRLLFPREVAGGAQGRRRQEEAEWRLSPLR